MPKNVVEQLEIGRYKMAATDKERAIDCSLENISQPVLPWVFVEPLTFEEQFKLKYGGS